MRRTTLTRSIGLALWATLLAPQLARAQTATPLTVTIEAPLGGVEDADHTTQLRATVSDPTITTATLSLNGASYEVPVEGGVISQILVVFPGVNRVGLRVARGTSSAESSVTWTVRGERTELMIIATWQARGEIIDLWTREPGGETCKWDHRSTESGGRLLDFSADAIGFGSQAYVATEVRPGTYRVKLHYWGSSATEDQRDSNEYVRLLDELDAAEERLASAVPALRATLEAQRDDARRALDAWAEPAAPQTPVHVEAVLFPGTPHERRFRFDRVIQRDGHLETLGEIEIDAAMVRAARAELGSPEETTR